MELFSASTMPNRVEILKQKFANSVGLPFEELLAEGSITEALEAEKVKYRNRLFNPIVTLWAFLSQVLDTDKSLQNAVSRIIARESGGWRSDSGGGYRRIL
jgi:hypothetical protein